MPGAMPNPGATPIGTASCVVSERLCWHIGRICRYALGTRRTALTREPVTVALDDADWTQPGRVRHLYRHALSLLRRTGNVVIDGRGVSRLDSKLIACLVAVRRAAAEFGGSLRIRPSEALLQWSEACRLGDALYR